MQNAVSENEKANKEQSLPLSTSLGIAYLVSEYPALSHTFITHEIGELEKRGHTVFPISIRRARNPKATEGVFARDAQRTFNLLEAVPKSFIPAVIAQTLKSPVGTLRMARKTLTLFQKKRQLVKSLAYLAEAFVLIREMKRLGVRHVHNHFGNAAANVALIASSSGEVDYSLSIHGPDIFYNIESDCLPEKVEGAAFTRCISHFSKSQLCLITQAKTWETLHIVRCGVDSSLFDPASKTNAQNLVPNILCVGRLVAAKGQQVLLAAAKELKNRGLDFHLTIVGTGPDEERLRNFSKVNDLHDFVTFTGGLPPADTLDQFRKADLFVLPSFAEGIPVVLMEAMSLEIPVISTPIAGIGELIENNHSGVLVPPSCVKSLANRIGDFLVSPDAWGELAIQGRQRVLDEFQKDKNGEAMNQLFLNRLS